MLKHKVIKVGIMPLEMFKQYTIAIAKGEYRPKKTEPKVWFNSMKSLANVLSEENQALLKLIIKNNPKSLKELAGISGRKANNLLRTLRTMENYGFVKLMEGKKGKGKTPLMPKVIYATADVEINFYPKDINELKGKIKIRNDYDYKSLRIGN
jgi:predicted transcriptional regulator